MKLVTYDQGGCQKLGVVRDGKVADLAALAENSEAAGSFQSSRRFLEGGDDAIATANALITEAETGAIAESWPALSEVRLHAPITNPPKILALAGNYRAHIKEGGGTVIPKEQLAPNVFTKPTTCIIGPNEAIRLPGSICPNIDYEGELGAVIGKTCHGVRVDTAMEYVAGYLNLNDVSGRTLNFEVPRELTPRDAFFDWLNGKWFDTFAPMGPWLALKDEVPDPQALDLELRVNGQVRQKAGTGDMIFSVAEIVAWISQYMTLNHRHGHTVRCGFCHRNLLAAR